MSALTSSGKPSKEKNTDLPCLIGYILFLYGSPPKDSTKTKLPSDRKRQRKCEQQNEAIIPVDHQCNSVETKSCFDSCINQSSYNVATLNDDNCDMNGLSFQLVTTEAAMTSESSWNHTILLSIPQHFIPMAYHYCCRFHHDDTTQKPLVRIVHYNILKISRSNNYQMNNQEMNQQQFLLEVNQMEVIDTAPRNHIRFGKSKGKISNDCDMNDINTLEQEVVCSSQLENSNVPVNATNNDDDIYWSIQQLGRREAFDKLQKYNTNDALYDFYGIIDSISPMITMDPEDPFLLIELIDTNGMSNNDFIESCIVVIRNYDNNKNHNFAIDLFFQPGDCIGLRYVKRRKWKIPIIIEQEMNKNNIGQKSDSDKDIIVPDYVFVVDNPLKQIRFNSSSRNSFSPRFSPLNFLEQPSMSKVGKRLITASILHPSLTTLQGKIIYVHRDWFQIPDHVLQGSKRKKRHQRVLNYYVALSLNSDENDIQTCNPNGSDNDRNSCHCQSDHYESSNIGIDCGTYTCHDYHNKRCHRNRIAWLYLSDFPMSSTLQLSLRRGAIIHASNVKPLIPSQRVLIVPNSSRCRIHHHNNVSFVSLFGACLRTNIKIITMATSEQEYQNTVIIDTQQQIQNRITHFFDNDDDWNNMPSIENSLHDVPSYAFDRMKCSHIEMFWIHFFENIIKEFDMECIRRRASNTTLTHENIAQDDSLPILKLEDVMNSFPVPCLSIRQKKQSSARNPYSEFFLHSVHDSLGDCNVSNEAISTDPDGQQNEYHTLNNEDLGDRTESRTVKPSTLNQIVGLNHIYACTISELSQRLKDYTKSNDIDVGWNGSFILSGESLFLSLGLKNNETNIRQFPYGLVYASTICIENLYFSHISNGHIRLPAVFDTHSNYNYETNLHPSTNEFAWIRIKCIHCSTTCIGTIDTATPYAHPSIHSLPANQDSKSKGACALLFVNGYIFIVSFFIECDRYKSVYGKVIEQRIKKSQFNSIENCLCFRQMDHTKNYVNGLMVRKFFRYPKFFNNNYDGYSIVLSSYCQSLEVAVDDIITTQSFDVKPTHMISTASRTFIEKAIPSSFRKILSDVQISLICTLWHIANSPQLCSLLGGGWDEKNENRSRDDLSNFSNRVGVRVLLPTYAIHEDAKRGYVRVRCTLDDVVASIITFRESRSIHDLKTHSSRDCLELFDFVGLKKVLPGDLDRRPKRICDYGEIINCHPTKCGISWNSLADLHKAACFALQNRTHKHNLSPSMVRMVHARFLQVSFCQAVAECSKCFSPLKRKIIRENSSSRHGSKLQCPNNCPIEENVSIKWECSGTLDDGSGQVKLYAERQVALCLLGMSKSTIDYIERGASQIENGIVYSIGKPPKPELWEEVIQLKQTIARYHHPLENTDILSKLSRVACAEYTMQRYCRLSTKPMRDMVYLVRCKPLSDNIHHINHSEIEIPGPQKKVSTYSLPPIKVNLVDCISNQILFSNNNLGSYHGT